MNVFSEYPKVRPVLPKSYQDIYEQHYFENREGQTQASSLSSKLEQWLHSKVANDVKSKDLTTLEIGAGTLNQLAYEPLVSKYDIVEPFHALYESSNHLKRIRNIYADISEVPENLSYDRITSIACFEHVENLPEVVAHTALKLNNAGCLRVSIPNEGTVLWKLGTKITGREFKKRFGLDYSVLMSYEHINTSSEIETILQYFFTNVKASTFGIHKGLGFYRFFNCALPKTDKAVAYLNQIK